MIRKISDQDIDRVIELTQQLWSKKKIDHKHMYAVIKTYIRDPNYSIYGYEEKNLLAFISVSLRWALYYEGRVAIIEDLIVDEAHQGKGIGARLIRFIEEIVFKNEDVKGIELSSDLHRKETFQFWEKCGYSKLAYQFRKERPNIK